MSRHPTVGFQIWSPPLDWMQVVPGPVFRPVDELVHAPEPLRGIGEMVGSSSYAFAARRYERELEARGEDAEQIIRLMNTPTPFTRVRINGEFADLPVEAALEAKTPTQARICNAAHALATRGDVEGFRFMSADQERPRLLFLPDAQCEAIEEIDCHHFTPAHLLPESWWELYSFGRWRHPESDG